MAYQPKVTEATIVSHNTKNGLYEVVVKLEDRTHCRLIYETLADGKKVATNISRLLKVPCPICKRDYLCHCMTPYLGVIGNQASTLIY